MVAIPATLESRVLAMHGVQARVDVVRLMQPSELGRIPELVEWHWLALKLPGERETRLLGRRRTVEELLPLIETIRSR